MLGRKDLGKGWLSVPMVNNAERLDPYGADDASAGLRQLRSERRLTALDEGAALRQRGDGSLAVVRVEVFASADDAAHRARWQEDGPACLEAVWRERWLERDRQPGWIEARWRDAARSTDLDIPDAVDWIVVEDQTGSIETVSVTVYEHLTCWVGRANATLTVRHDLGHDLDAVVAHAADVVCGRLALLDP